MAQESWKKETDETEFHAPEVPILCINNCGFFGSPMTNNLCSKCYRDSIMKKQTLITPPTPELEKLAPNLASSSKIMPTQFEPIEENSKKSEEIVTEKMEERKLEISESKPLVNRCFLCKKKVGLTGFKCRCGGTFCSIHRYSESHKCFFDYKTAGRDAIAKENPLIMAEKIKKI